MYSWPVFELLKAICKIIYEVDLQVYMKDLAKDFLAVKFEVACFLRILLNSKTKTLRWSKWRVSDLLKKKEQVAMNKQHLNHDILEMDAWKISRPLACYWRRADFGSSSLGSSSGGRRSHVRFVNGWCHFRNT